MSVSRNPETRTLTAPHFSVLRSLKLGTFHIGSALTDLLTSAVWNRILIADMGAAAWPIGLLTALRYLLAPLTLWIGHRSDTRPLFGSRRVAYIWLGRLLMLLSLPLLPAAVAAIAVDLRSGLGWGLAALSFVSYGIGTLISGAPFLALVHDSAPYARRGQAVSIVQFVLILSFAFLPAAYAWLMPTYDPALFWRLVWVGLAGAALFWIFAVWGEERPLTDSAAPASSPALAAFRPALGAIWRDACTRRYAALLSASAFFAFMQDALLEPFGGEVFGLPVGETTLFNAYWGAGVLVSMVGAYLATRRRRPEQQDQTAGLGLALLSAALLLLGLASALGWLSWVRPVLVIFGLGFGIFTVGGVSLLMAMSSEEKAGVYMALWTMVQLTSRGAGIAAGGVLRDVALALTGQHSLAYATVLFIEAAGLLVAIALLRRADIRGFAARRDAGLG